MLWVDFPEFLSCLCFTKRGLPFVFAPRNPHHRLLQILRWYACGADGGRSTVRWLPNFLGCVAYHILLYDPYGPARAFIAKLLRKSPYEGRTWWREQVRKKPSGPARIAYGPHTGILSIARARSELKQLCCCINPDFSVKMSNIPNFVKKKKEKKGKKEKRGGHIIKCLLTELGRAGRENIWPSVMAHGPRCARSVRHDLGPNIFPSGPPTQSISTYSCPWCSAARASRARAPLLHALLLRPRG